MGSKEAVLAGATAILVTLSGCAKASDTQLQANAVELPRPVEHYSSALLGQLMYELSGVLSSPLTEEVKADLEHWQEINPATQAIIEIPDYRVYEPVLQAEDNKQWLRTDIYGNYSVAGTVFFDARSDLSYTPVKMVHGHNMSDGSIFGRLPEMLQLDDCTLAPSIYLHTKNGTSEYRVFSVMSVNSKEEAFPIDPFNGDEDMDELIQDLLDRSLVPNGKPETQDLLVLNTCWYGESGSERNLHCVIACSRVGI